MDGTDKLLRFYLEHAECTFDVFLSWFQNEEPVAPPRNPSRGSRPPSGSPADPRELLSTPPKSPGRPPPELLDFRPELGLALVNFLRDQSAGIRETSQQCYPSPAKAVPQAAKYDYQSPTKAPAPKPVEKKSLPRDGSEAVGVRRGSRGESSAAAAAGKGANNSGGGAKKRVQLFGDARADGDDLDIIALAADPPDAAGDKFDKLEERFSGVPPVELKMVTTASVVAAAAAAPRERKGNGRRSLESSFRNHGQDIQGDRRGPPTAGTLNLGDFVTIKKGSDKQAAKKNRKKKSKSLSPSVTNSQPRVLQDAGKVLPDVRELSEAKQQEESVRQNADAAATRLNFEDTKEIEAKPLAQQDADEEPAQPPAVPQPQRIEKHDIWMKIVKSIGTAVPNPKEEVASALLASPGKELSQEPLGDNSLVKADPLLVTSQDKLDKLAKLYSFVLKRNLCINISAELYLMTELLTCQETCERAEMKKNMLERSTTEERSSSLLLDTVHNCVYFAAASLDSVRHLLRHLDDTAHRFLSRNPRLRRFCPDLAAHLGRLPRRGALPPLAEAAGAAASYSGGPMESVRYDPSKDSVSNFPSERNFQDYKKQRDLLYEMLRGFVMRAAASQEGGARKEERPLHERIKKFGNVGQSQMDFLEHFGESMRTLLGLSTHPVNLARLAKLFRDQMMTMCASEAMEAERVDPLKIASLEQRITGEKEDLMSSPRSDALVAAFGVGREREDGGKFFGSQRFFKEFIIGCNNYAFISNLRLSLVEVIKEKDGERFVASGGADIGYGETAEDERFASDDVVRLANVIISLRTAAKFLGLIDTLMFRSRDSSVTAEILRQQVALREQTPFSVNLLDMLRQSLRERRLVVTLPWIAEFISVLDPVSMRCGGVRTLLETISDVYKSILRREGSVARVSELGTFLLNIILGELFENPLVPRELFFNTPLESDTAVSRMVFEDVDEEEAFVPRDSKGIHLDEVENAIHPDLVHACRCLFLWESKRLLLQYAMGKKSGASTVATADDLARRLASQRVKVPLSKGAEDAGKGGKKKISLLEASASLVDDEARKKLLLEPTPDEEGATSEEQVLALLERNFLHSQSPDLRHSVEFISNLIFTKLTNKVLLSEEDGGALAGGALKQVEEHMVGCIRLGFVDPHDVEGSRKVREEIEAQVGDLAAGHCMQLRRDAKAFLDEEVPRRVEEAMEMLLPDNIDGDTKRQCILLGTKKARKRGLTWIRKNVTKKLLAKTFMAILNKQWDKQAALLEDPGAKLDVARQQSTAQTIASPVKVIAELRELTEDLATGKRKASSVSPSSALQILADIEKCFDDREQTSVEGLKGLVHLSVDWAVTMVVMAPKVMSAEVQDKLVTLWLTFPPLLRDDLHDILSLQNIYQMGFSPDPRDSWFRMEALIVRLCKAELILPLVLEDQCLALTRMEWPQSVLERLASCLQGVVDSWKKHVSAGGFTEQEEEFPQLIDWLIWFWGSPEGGDNFEEDFPDLC